MEVVGVYLMKIVIALAIFFGGKFLVKKGTDLAKTMMRKGKVDETLVSFSGNVMYGAALAFLIIAALSQLGINTTSLAAVVAAAGLAIGLSMQDSLSNLAAGVMIILFKPFKLGDYVEAGGTDGTVEGISIFTTSLKTPDNKHVIVPNGSIISGIITNYSAKEQRRIDMVIGVSYDDDLSKVKKSLEKILAKEKRILKEPAPVIAVSELADNSVNLVVRPWVNTADYWPVRFDLTEAIKVTFDKEDISFPFPQREVHIANSDAVSALAGKPASKGTARTKKAA